MPSTCAREPLQFYLDLFNRKERNLLIRDALGDSQSKLFISKGYLDRLAKKLEIQAPSPSLVSWWTDYHIDWIVGALTLFAKPQQFKEERNLTALQKRPTNALSRNTSANSHRDRLISGSQEDADLVISFENTIILIEAKAFTNFTQKQVYSKARRLAGIKKYYDKLKPEAPEIQIYSVLTSPKKPLNLQNDPKVIEGHSKGAAKIAWMHLYIDDIQEKFRVTRCGPNGLRSSAGEYWRCVRAMRFSGLDYESVED